MARNDDRLVAVQMHHNLDPLVSLVNDINFKIHVVVPKRLLGSALREGAALTVVAKARNLLGFEVREIALLWLIFD